MEKNKFDSAKKKSRAAGQQLLAIHQLSCFRDLPWPLFTEIYHYAEPIACKKNQILWSPGDRAESFVVTIRGILSVHKTNENGDENILGLFGPGDVLGLSATLRLGTYPATARTCCSGSEIAILSLGDLRKHAASGQGALSEFTLDRWLQKLVLAHENVLQDKISFVAGGNLSERTAHLLKSLVSRFGTWTDPSTAFIPLPLTKTLIAKLVGARIETVIRLLRHWEKAGVLEMMQAGTVIDISKLSYESVQIA